MSKQFIIVLVFIIAAIFLGVSLYSQSSKPAKEMKNQQKFLPLLTGMERAKYLISLSKYKDSIKEDAVLYELPAEDIHSSQGYSINSEIFFSLYDLKDFSKVTKICEDFKREIALENIQTYCSTNGTTLFLGYAPANKKNILSDIVSSFAGEE